MAMHHTHLAVVLLIILSTACRNPNAVPAERNDSEHSTTNAEVSPRKIRDILLETKRAFETHQTVDQLASVLSVKPKALENTGWWRVALPIEEILVTVGTDKETGHLDEVDFAFPVARGLRLTALTTDFGTSKTIHEGQTSSVLFTTNPSSEVAIYADLLSAQVAPNALVVGVRFLRTPSPPPTAARIP